MDDNTRRHFIGRCFAVPAAARAVSGCAKPPVLTLQFSPASGVVGDTSTITGSVRPGTGQAGCQIASWVLSFGDGVTMAGTAPGAFSVTHTYPDAGTYTLDLVAQTFSGLTKAIAASIVIRTAPAITPSLYGPQPDVTQPTGSVTVNAGTNLVQPAVAANAAGTTFWIAAGLSTMTSAIGPKG